ncbi:MAG: DUF935 domain-containing protein [Candidatus Peribacteria bacterium]|jgi:hypothetical protein|nr:DUF935 domain-containing protein [Candidatus Peribacteria bacterium]
MDIPQAQHIRQTIKDKGAEIQDLMLATFLKLGSSEKGSYGMAKQGENLFLSSIEFIVKQICGVINSTLIPLLVDFNFGKQENYPELSYGTIGDVDRKALSEVFGVLSNARLLTPDTNTEQRFRDQLGLPEKEENAEPTTVPTEPTP